MPFVSLSRPTALVLVSALLAALVLVGSRIAGTGAARGPEPAAVPLEPVAAAAPRNVVVHVVGAVRRPGLYRLREGTRVADALARAGGASRRANLAGLNLAAPLADGAQVLVPERLAAVAAGSPAAGAGAPASTEQPVAVGQKLSLSTATAEQLDELPGVGPVTAQKILDYRADHGFIRSVDDLDAVPGIGPARIEQLRDLVTP